jgi:hypothetical protein
MNNFDPKKFVFHELFTNTNGKQSSSGFIGVLCGLVGLTAFLACVVGYFLQIPNTLEVIGKTIELLGISCLLLGVRKVSGAVVAKKINDKEDSSNNDDMILETPKKG